MLSDGFEMLIQTFLRRTIVVRGYRQAADDTTVIEARCVKRSCASAVAVSAGPSNYQNAPISQISVIITTSACFDRGLR